MRSAPPAVDVPLPSGRRERCLVAALHGAAAALVSAWACARWGGLELLAWPLAGIAGAWLGFFVLAPLQGRLRWDGECWWQLPPEGPALRLHRLDLMIDLGGWMLLRARSGGPRAWAAPGRWCAVAAADVPSCWHGLRLALYHGPASPLPSSAPPMTGRASA